jgi:hypothetical protein
MAKFDTDGKHLYIDGKKVLRGCNSFKSWGIVLALYQGKLHRRWCSFWPWLRAKKER